MSREDNDRGRKVPPACDEHRPVAGKKNTKRWCKGKVGREHKMEWVRDVSRDAWFGKQHSWTVWKCSECGKQLDYCWPSPGWVKRSEPCKCGRHVSGKK